MQITKLQFQIYGNTKTVFYTQYLTLNALHNFQKKNSTQMKSNRKIVWKILAKANQ